MIGLPNLLTLSRLVVSVPFYFFLWRRENFGVTIVLLLGLYMVLTDLFDGYLARRLNRVSFWGKVMDAVFDKLIVDLTAIVLVARGELPFLLFLPLLTRDLLLGVCGLYMLKLGGYNFQRTFIGRLTPLTWAIAMTFIVVGANTIGLVLAFIGNILAILSAYIYIKRAILYLQLRRTK